jgi:hypothetical protein
MNSPRVQRQVLAYGGPAAIRASAPSGADTGLPARGVAGKAPPPGARPISLTLEQLGAAQVTQAERAITVLAWLPWTDGHYYQVAAFAGAWTSQAVRLRWLGEGAVTWDVWTWASAVRRASN